MDVDDNDTNLPKIKRQQIDNEALIVKTLLRPDSYSYKNLFFDKNENQKSYLTDRNARYDFLYNNKLAS